MKTFVAKIRHGSQVDLIPCYRSEGMDRGRESATIYSDDGGGDWRAGKSQPTELQG